MKKIFLGLLMLSVGGFFVAFQKDFIATVFDGNRSAQNTEMTAESSTIEEKDLTETDNTTETRSVSVDKPIASVEKTKVEVVQKESLAIPETIKKVSLNTPVQTVSEPMVSFVDKNEGTLQSSGVLQWTNRYREENNLLNLTRNAQLDAAAIMKIHDMFEFQYFEHMSPSGKDVTTLVSGVGYDYLLVGENLALGNFENEKALVDAWMGSPGHRANILKGNYSEIGIAVAEGNFEGRKVWMAVQEFGRPASACPPPDALIKQEIETDKADVSTHTVTANELMAQMNAFESEEDYDSYNALVPKYNATIAKINFLIEEVGTLVNQYNKQVENYQMCVGIVP